MQSYNKVSTELRYLTQLFSLAYKAWLFEFDNLATKLQHSSLLVNTHVQDKASTWITSYVAGFCMHSFITIVQGCNLVSKMFYSWCKGISLHVKMCAKLNYVTKMFHPRVKGRISMLQLCMNNVISNIQRHWF